MRTVYFLTVSLILTFMLVFPGSHVSATKTRARGNYAPGEVIVKLKRGAPELQLGDREERLMTIARMSGDKGAPLAGRSAETLVRFGANQRASEIISGRGLDRVFVLKFDQNADVRAMVDELRSLDQVEYA